MGAAEWRISSENLEIEFPPLWNLDEKERAEVDSKYAEIMNILTQAELISRETAIEELAHRKIFNIDILSKDIPEKTEVEYNNYGDPINEPDNISQKTIDAGIGE